MKVRECDVLVIGAGPGGLAAAKAAKETGAGSVIILERDTEPGGILNQCIHDGFGLIRYQQTLTGPEYAARAISEALESGVEVLTGYHVTCISEGKIAIAYTRFGIESFHARSIVLATGCRERTRGNISIPGSRPAGIFTAGVAQNLVNRKNVMIGKRVVILGSGDIGLIMARRLMVEGGKVLAVVEILPEPCGLSRNVSQCLYEFDIPLYVNTTVSKIIGKAKLEAVELSEVDETQKPIPGTQREIECNALVLSVGLIPENEVAMTAGVELNHDNSVCTDAYLQTSIQGIFSCGNSRHVMDLADYVSEQGELAGKNAVHYIRGESMSAWDEEKTNCMKKGFPKKDTVTCVVCPNGCQVKWDLEKQEYIGNKCIRGAEFAMQERTDPKRIVTTTVRVRGGKLPLAPVRTAEAVNRKDVFSIIEKVRELSVEANLSLGDAVEVIQKNERRISIVAAADV